MSDPNTDSPVSNGEPGVADQLTKSLSSIWQQHAGARPGSASTELSGDVVRFVMSDAVSTISLEVEEGSDEQPSSPDTIGYRNEAIAAVRRITGRRVQAFIPKRDAKTDAASDTYILEPPRIAR
jgi:hypothetical protein